MKNRSRFISLQLLTDIWNRYCEFRRPQVSSSTFHRDYQKFSKRLAKMQAESPHLRNAIDIRDWLLEHYSPETARRTIEQFNAACSWAKEFDMLQTNPFEGMKRHLPRSRPGPDNWAAFNSTERDRIIAAFDKADPYYSSWVRFLFWTGCRPEEAAALQWQKISADNREILFDSAWPTGEAEPQGTKNGKTTRFPCNDRLQRLIQAQRDLTGGKHGTWVFPAIGGGRFDYENFQTRHWREIVGGLADSGDVAFYLPQYHCRHTWITGALEAGLSVQDVAYLARTSTMVIYQHYAARARRPIIPEF